MLRERPDHLLQSTALVHEAYLRLVDHTHVRWQTRAHFFAVAAQVMRHILVDHARGRGRAKRGSGIAELPLHDVAVVSDARADELLAVHSALEKQLPRQATCTPSASFCTNCSPVAAHIAAPRPRRRKSNAEVRTVDADRMDEPGAPADRGQ